MQKRGEIIKNRALEIQKRANNEVTFMLYIFLPSGFSFVFWQILRCSYLLNPYIPKIIIISWWIELMQMIKLWLWAKPKAFTQSFLLKKRNKTNKIQYKKLEKLISMSRRPAKVPNYKFMCIMIYIIENGCKWRVLLEKYGKVYVKFNKWSKNDMTAKAIAFFL